MNERDEYIDRNWGETGGLDESQNSLEQKRLPA